jgi:cell division protein ZapA (FtsZ GTPase activity inhibitor)
MAASKARARALSIELGGHNLTVRSDADNATVEAIVADVNERLDMIRRSAPRAPDEKVALLCALNIAEELFAEREKHEALKSRVADDSRRLLSVVDRLEGLAPEPPEPAEEEP